MVSVSNVMVLAVRLALDWVSALLVMEQDDMTDVCICRNGECRTDCLACLSVAPCAPYFMLRERMAEKDRRRETWGRKHRRRITFK